MKRFILIAVLLSAVLGWGHGISKPANGEANIVWSEDRTVVLGKKEFRVRVVYVNLKSSWTRVTTALGSDRVGGTEELSALAKRHGAVAAINGTFFNSYSDMQPQGNIQINGEFVHLSTTGTTVGFTGTKEVRFAPLRPSVTGTTDNNDDFLHNWYAWGINHVVENPAAIEIFTPAKGSKTGTAAGTSVIVKNGVVDSVVRGEALIPGNGFVINFGDGPDAAKYTERFTRGTSVEYSLSFTDPEGSRVDWEDVRYSIGAGPRLLKDGEVIVDFKYEGFTDPKITTNRGARSAIGKTGDNILILAAVNNATVPELALIMKALESHSYFPGAARAPDNYKRGTPNLFRQALHYRGEDHGAAERGF